MTIFSGKKLSWDLPPPAPTHSFVSCPVGLGWSQGGGVCERLLASFSVWFPRFGVPLLLGDLFYLGSGMADPRISGSPRPIASGLQRKRTSPRSPRALACCFLPPFDVTCPASFPLALSN